MIFRLLALFVLFLGVTALLRAFARMLGAGRNRPRGPSRRRFRRGAARPAEFEVLDDDPPRR